MNASPIALLGASEIVVDSDDALLAATTHGLFSLGITNVLAKCAGQPQRSSEQPGLLCAARTMTEPFGSRLPERDLVRISASEFDKWLQQSDSKPAMDVFDRFDGALSGRGPFLMEPSATTTADGRLWFVAGAVVQMIDPRQTFQNRIPPPVHIEEVVADKRKYSPGPGLRLFTEGSCGDLEIDYSGLSFVAPQKVRFRY